MVCRLDTELPTFHFHSYTKNTRNKHYETSSQAAKLGHKGEAIKRRNSISLEKERHEPSVWLEIGNLPKPFQITI